MIKTMTVTINEETEMIDLDFEDFVILDLMRTSVELIKAMAEASDKSFEETVEIVKVVHKGFDR